MNTCATCLSLVVGRAVVRCGQRWAPKAALPFLPSCERWEQADDALVEARPATVERGPWNVPEGAHEGIDAGIPQSG
jgi:hypothetical protein